MSWGAGDWMCGACQHMNFKKRDTCQRCGISKYGGQVEAYDSSGYGSYMDMNMNMNTNSNRTEVLAGDWYCQGFNCGAHNYASRTTCFRCGAQKTVYYEGSNDTVYSGGFGSEASTVPGWKTGDWICTRAGCGVHNYACRTECFRCKTKSSSSST